MVSVNDALSGGPKPPLGATLAAGVDFIAADQLINFELYRKFVSPLDGMVYWLKVVSDAKVEPYPALTTITVESGISTQIVSGSLLSNVLAGGVIINPLEAVDQGLKTVEPLFVNITGPADSAEKNTTISLNPGEKFTIPQAVYSNGIWVNSLSAGHKFTVNLWIATPSVDNSTTSVQVKGSLHYTSETEQIEEDTMAISEVVFTSLSKIQPFHLVHNNFLYIGSYQNIRFAFRRTRYFFEQADLYHYVGNALYSLNQNLVVDNPIGWEPPLAVSNSLPIWLSLNGYVPPYPDGFRCPIQLYPSFLVENNLPPPFASVHIENTEALQAAPQFGRTTWSQDQSSKDIVRVTFYGADNLMAETFLVFFEQYSVDWSILGLMNMPIVKDEKRVQSEFEFISMKKTMDFEVSYFQSAARDLGRQLIKEAMIKVYPNPNLVYTGAIQ